MKDIGDTDLNAYSNAATASLSFGLHPGPRETQTPQKRKARILVVEDDASQLEIRRQILEHAGYETVCAQDFSEALERWVGCPVVVMDLRIPEREDGLRLIQATSLLSLLPLMGSSGRNRTSALSMSLENHLAPVASTFSTRLSTTTTWT